MIPTALTFIAAAAAVAVSLELLARLWMARYGAYFVHAPGLRQEFTIDANALPSLPSRVRFAANRDGERADPRPKDPSAVHRVLVAGGSAAECYMLDQPDTWPMVLQKSLNASGALERPAHVGNIARSLMPCRSIDQLMERALPRFQSLDVIVLMVGASDLVAWFEAKTPAEKLQSARPARDYFDEHPEGPFHWSLKGSALYRVARRLRSHFPAEPARRSNVGGSIVKHRAMRANAKSMLHATPDPTAMLENFRADLGQLIRTCRGRAARVIVARQPWLDAELSRQDAKQLWNFGQGSPYRGAVDTYYAMPVVRDLMAQVDDVARSVAEECGAEAVDLRSAVPSDLDHYYDTLHFTPAGAKRVGQRLAEVIAQPRRPAEGGQDSDRGDAEKRAHLRAV